MSNSSFKNVQTNEFKKEIEVASSKSFANRALVLAALSEKEVELKNIPLSSDVSTMISCLKKIGLKVDVRDNTVVISNSFPACEKEDNILLETGDGGTTNRFLISLLALGSKKYHIEPKCEMRNRPMSELFNFLSEHGASIETDKHWLSIKGPIKLDKEVEIDCSRSTQFITGLSLALNERVELIKAKNLTTSKSYYEMTLDLINQFHSGKTSFEVPVDFSSLGYPLALACLYGSVLVKNCRVLDKFQADSVFIKFLKSMGASIHIDDRGIFVEKTNLKGGEFDCSDCPDLVPTLAFVCSYANGKSRIRNIEVLKHKESDRLSELFKILDLFEVSYTYENDCLEIDGRKPFEKIIEHCPADDHRMVMVTYLFMRLNGGGRLGNASAIEKSFSNFYDLMD